MIGKSTTIERMLPLVIIIALIIAAYFLGLTSYLTIDSFMAVHSSAMEFVAHHPYLSPLLFIGIYIIYASLALPGIILLTVLGGFIFPQPLSTLYVIFSATAGGIILFLSAKRASAGFIARADYSLISRMERGFQHSATGYMLFLRLVPIFPYWLVTVTSAIFQVRLTTFIWTTFFGIIPCAFFVTEMGGVIIMILENEGQWSARSLLIRLQF